MPFDSVVELAKKLVSIPSPPGGEHEIAEFITKHIGKYADSVESVEVGGCGPSIVFTHKGKKGRPTIVLNGHMDTVHEAEGWDQDPYEGRIEDGKLYGLGACDMKAGLAVLIDVFKELKKEKGINLVLGMASDEEGNSLGSYNLIKEGLVEGDLCLIPEPTHEQVMLGCRGRYVLEIVVRGKAAHGARPHLGNNAIEDAARVISRIRKIKPRKHDKLGRGSTCILKIEGGGDTLSVPDKCVIRVDRHVVTGETQEMIMDDFRKVLQELDIMSELEFRWMERPTPFLEPYITKKSEFVKAFLLTYKEQFGREGQVVYGESVGDYNLFGARMPTVVCGPSGGDWHSPNEFVEIDSITRIRDLYLRMLKFVARR